MAESGRFKGQEWHEGHHDEGPEPFDLELDWALSQQREEEKSDQPPAEWWEERLDGVTNATADAARQSLHTLANPVAGRRVDQGDLLEALRAVALHVDHYTPPREALLAHARKVGDLRRRSGDLRLDVAFEAGRLEHQLEAAELALAAYATDLAARAEAIKRDPDWALNQDVFRLVRLVERATGRPHYGQLCKLLAVAGVARTPDALKTLASRKARQSGQPRSKHVVKLVKAKNPRGRPRKPDNAKRRGSGRVVLVDDEDTLAALADKEPDRRRKHVPVEDD